MDPAPDVILPAYERWLHARAAVLLPPDTLHRGTAQDRADLVQVGRIAVWDAASRYDPDRGAEPSWVTRRANGAMMNALRPRAKHALYAVPLSFDDPDDDVSDVYDLDDIIMRAYHAGDIAAALAELTPRQREYVRLRFWGQRTSRELAEHFGYDPRGVWAGARQKLSASLAHLRDVG